jgi:hypothetical protein
MDKEDFQNCTGSTGYHLSRPHQGFPMTIAPRWCFTAAAATPLMTGADAHV